MKKISLFILFFIFILASIGLAKESEEELRTYLSDMNRIVIVVEDAMRNVSMNILPAKNAAEKISSSIEKFEVLKAPSIFLKDHNNMLTAFKFMRDGLKLYSESEREKSVALVKEGAVFFKNAGLSIRTIAEQEGLIPVRPKPSEATKPILPPITPAPIAIAGISPTPSPHISSPDIETGIVIGEGDLSSGINLMGTTYTTSITAASTSLLAVIGKIVSIDRDGDYFRVAVEEDSGEMLKFDVKQGECSIIIDNKPASIDRIDKGMDSCILYDQSTDKNQAKSITILKPEDVALFKRSIESATVVPADLKGGPTE